MKNEKNFDASIIILSENSISVSGIKNESLISFRLLLLNIFSEAIKNNSFKDKTKCSHMVPKNKLA